MTYLSTRGQAPILPFDEVLLAGLAPDGGLYLPTAWPRFSPAEFSAMAGLPYAGIAARVMRPFLDGAIAEDDFADMVAESYAGFDHQAVAPLVQLAPNDWLLELFHGPTFSFKDYALQLVGRLFDHVLAKKGRRVTIVAATSGDTGSAAIEACRDRPAIEIVILHPRGRVSEVQRRQMTTVPSANVHNIAIEGNFDDCQNLVKALFADAELRDRAGLAAVNSINWARIMAQIVYYVASAVALGAPGREIAFAVPTGNFGNIYAGASARRMGLPVAQLIEGSNANDILTRFFASGEMRRTEVVPTLSPSMDIQVSSNFERALFDAVGADAGTTSGLMASFGSAGVYAPETGAMSKLRGLFSGYRLDDDGTIAVMREHYERNGQMIDPHTAIGLAAGRARRADPAIPLVTLSTAHPAKFPDAVELATGVRPELPPRLAALFDLPERCQALPNDLAMLKDAVRQIAMVPA